MMSIIFCKQFADPIEALRQYKQDFEAWIFADRDTRLAIQAEFKDKGQVVTLHSAYKPLVSFFIESDIDWNTTSTLRVGVPVHPLNKDSQRFYLEAYPLSGLYPHIEFYSSERADAQYRVQWQCTGELSREITVFAPNHVHDDCIGEQHLSPTAWLKLSDGSVDQPIDSAYEQLFWQTLAAIIAQPYRNQVPLFEQLLIDVTLPIKDHPLPFYDESISLREALHEEFYFSLLEWVQQRSNKPSGSRDIRPGQIVPNIRYGETYSSTVTLAAYPEQLPVVASTPALTPSALSSCDRTLTLAQVNGALTHLIKHHQGKAFSGNSVLGQTVHGAIFEHDTTAGGALITGAQHANETTGVVGGLRACHDYLRQTPAFPIAIIPVHNVDGYQLYHQLLKDNPHHMHHAARYSAHGNDIEYQQPDEKYERALRDEGISRVNALLHLNLHGYPAHEWTRPLTGYIPKNFDLWSIPKGFFLIMRYQPGFASVARALIETVTCALGKVPTLVDYNQAQISCYEIHNQTKEFEVIQGFPVMFTESEQLVCPLTLITEFPDESIQGERFVLGQEAQRVTVLTALQALDTLNQLANSVAKV